MRRVVRSHRLVMAIIVFAPVLAGAAQARDFQMGGESNDPYTIHGPRSGTLAPHHAKAQAKAPISQSRASLLGREEFIAKRPRRPDRFFASRGSSGLVLPGAL